MKLGFTLKDIKVGDKATIGEVSINVQYAPGELVGEYELIKRAMKELPEMVADLGTGAMAFEEMDQAFDGYVTTKVNPESTEEVKTGAIYKVISAINNIKNNYAEKAEENKAV